MCVCAGRYGSQGTHGTKALMPYMVAIMAMDHVALVPSMGIAHGGAWLAAVRQGTAAGTAEQPPQSAAQITEGRASAQFAADFAGRSRNRGGGSRGAFSEAGGIGALSGSPHGDILSVPSH